MSQKYFLCPIKDIEPGQKKRFVVEGKAIMVANVEGQFYAVEDTCTHATASLTTGFLHGCEIECPRHGARFDLRTGEVTVLPAVMPLKTYSLQMEDEKIYVMLEKAPTEGQPEIICEGGICKIIRKNA